jgi:hypothetical protein
MMKSPAEESKRILQLKDKLKKQMERQQQLVIERALKQKGVAEKVSK